MPTISSVLSSFPLTKAKAHAHAQAQAQAQAQAPWKLLLMRRGLVDNTTNFGAISASQISRLQVKVDNFQDPFKINDFGKVWTVE